MNHLDQSCRLKLKRIASTRTILRAVAEREQLMGDTITTRVLKEVAENLGKAVMPTGSAHTKLARIGHEMKREREIRDRARGAGEKKLADYLTVFLTMLSEDMAAEARDISGAE